MNIVDLNRFIKVNDLQEVTNPIIFENGSYPTEGGLLSYSLFGIPGSYDRKTIFCYIDLKKHFLHPLMYKNIVEMNRKVARIIDGSGYFKITAKGELVEDNENGETGIEWFYQNFDKIKFDNTESMKRNNKVNLLKSMNKNEIFVDKWLVVPAAFRDTNIDKKKHGRLSVDELTRIYQSLLSLCQSSDAEFDLMGYLTESKIQKTINQIYEYLVGYLEKKTGLIQKDLLGKNCLAQIKLF
jgi:hypothetical protein